MSEPIAVVGASLAGMAAAARLAKQGHRVLLFEATDALGGRWARPGVLPPVISLPAPWRDLFRKSGRPFDAELTRAGYALVPAAPAVHRFTDGSELTLPSDRGEQWTVLSAAWGSIAATRWRDLLDELDERWQVLRRLGLEDEFPDAALTPRLRKALGLGRSVERLARGMDHPQAAALIRSTAWRIGSEPRRTPGFVAVRLAVDRTFGRWQLTRDGRPVPAAALIDLLAARLALRGVELRVHQPVTALRPGAVVTATDETPTAAIVSAVNPWEYLRLAGKQDPALRRRTAWTRPALAPLVTTTVEESVNPTPADGGRIHTVLNDSVREVVHHLPRGVRVEYRLPGQLITHDFTAGAPDPGFGTRWRSPRTWLRLPPLRTGILSVVSANASSRGGNDPWAQLLSGALAAYVVHENLTGADIRPTNKAVRP
ncbi:MAG: FAD-dependent oxidoreductase [Micropruina sp.]|nr:FAD-dependent oxidoreductase [Micropruina sp.]